MLSAWGAATLRSLPSTPPRHAPPDHHRGAAEAHRLDLPRQLGRIVATLIPAAPQVVKESVGAAGYMTPGPFGEGAGVEPVPHGGAVHPHAAGDPPQGHPLLVQLDDALVSLQTAGAPLLAPCGPVVRREPLRGGLTGYPVIIACDSRYLNGTTVLD